MNALIELGRLAWATGSPRIPGCAIPAPWWANRAVWFGATVPAAVALGLLVPAGMPWWRVLGIAVLIASVATAGMWAAERLAGRRVPWHVHCDDCGVCSLTLGVPGGDSLDEADQEATGHGWHLERPGDEDAATYCPSCRPRAGFPVLAPEVWR